jgi:hypothetical protein
VNRAEVVQRLRALWAAAPALSGVTIITTPGVDEPRESILVGASVSGDLTARRVGTPRPWDDSFGVSVSITSMLGTSLPECETRLEQLVNGALDVVLAAPSLGLPAITDLIGLDLGGRPVTVTYAFGSIPNSGGFGGNATFDLPFHSQRC